MTRRQPDVVISFELFSGSLGELRDAQAHSGREAQVDRIDPHVAKVLLDGSYEVTEKLTREIRVDAFRSDRGLASSRRRRTRAADLHGRDTSIARKNPPELPGRPRAVRLRRVQRAFWGEVDARV